MGIIAVQQVLQLCLEQGAQLAQPGEFTLRAFLNGRLDLTQAESIADLVGARSPPGGPSCPSWITGKVSYSHSSSARNLPGAAGGNRGSN